MSTDTDGAPPAVSPPDPGPDRRDAEDADPPRPAGPAATSWVQQEILRRVAENRSRGGGRHSAADDAEPYVSPFGAGGPRHGVPAERQPVARPPDSALGGPSTPVSRRPPAPGVPDARPLGTVPRPVPPAPCSPPARPGPPAKARRTGSRRPGPGDGTRPVPPAAPVLFPPGFGPATAEPDAPPDGRPPDGPAAAITDRIPAVGGVAVPGQRRPEGVALDAPIVSERVRVVLSERRRAAKPVRTVEVVQEGTGVGELLRTSLIRSQLTTALWFAAAAGLTLGALPLLFAYFPAIGQAEVYGLRVPWLLLGILVYPFLLGLGWLHTRTAERVEQSFADHVQD